MSNNAALLAPLGFLLVATLARAQTPIAQFDGQVHYAYAGTSVTSMGDLDGDGLPDFAAGGPANGVLANDPGRVYFCKGSDGSLIDSLQGIANALDFGFAIDNVGDVDGDGTADIVIGAPDLVSTGGHVMSGTAGYVRLYSGATRALLLHLDGDAPNDMYGIAVAGLGDVDADGVPDFAVGASGHDGGASDGGLVRAHSGADGSILWSQKSTQVGAGFGARLSQFGDLDGDGVRDLLMGSPSWDVPPQTDRGAAWVLSGANGVALRGWSGITSDGLFGSTLVDLRDVDGDGVHDVAVGAPWEPPVTSRGRVDVFSGASGAVLFTKVGQVNSEGFGMKLGNGGDLDGDGRDDLLIGSPYRSLPGENQNGYVGVHSGLDGTPFGMLIGPDDDWLGWAVAGIGDVDGDGRREFLAAGLRAAYYSAGFVQVVSTDIPMPPSRYCQAKVNSQGCTPAIGHSGTPSLGGADDFVVRASDVINKKYGLLLWSGAPQAYWFQGGTLCVAAPQKRTPVLYTGGSSGAPDCSGELAFLFSHAYMQTNGLAVGSSFSVQAWHRDTALPYNQVGLSDALLVFVAP